jgi:hypothetical protein
MNQNAIGYVCAHHPQVEEVGTVLLQDQAKRVMVHESKGAVYLPVSDDLLRSNYLAMGGFVKRSWGSVGWVFAANRAESGSPIAISVHSGQTKLYWAAGVGAFDQKQAYSGSLQLVTNRAIPGSVTTSVIERSESFAMADGSKGLVLRGALGANVLSDGLFAGHLWGVGQNLAVRWLAVSQVRIGDS